MCRWQRTREVSSKRLYLTCSSMSARLCNLGKLAVRWDTTSIYSICQEECKGILVEMFMLNKMGTPVCGGGFPLDNHEFKTWLHLKMLINAEMPLIDLSHPTPIDCVIAILMFWCSQFDVLILMICVEFAAPSSIVFCLTLML
jgi:hypothetical protein